MGKSVEGAVPSDLQGGKPIQEPDNSVGQPQPTGQGQPPQEEPFLGVSNPQDLSPELRPIYDNWVKGYGEKRELETQEIRDIRSRQEQMQAEMELYRQKADSFDELSANPEFQRFAAEWTLREQGQDNRQPNDYQLQGDYSGYEEGADGVKNLVGDIVGAVKQELRQELDPLRQQVSNVQSGFARQQQDTEWNILVNQAKEKSWTDPNLLKDNIDFIRQKHPTLSLPDAYVMADAQRQRSNPLQVRQPVDGGQAPQQQQGKIPVAGEKGPVNPPGGAAVRKTEPVGTSLLEKLVGDRKTGKSKPGDRVKINTIMNRIAEGLNAQGATIDVRDL